jgi:uncharacterized protein YjbI with pentapeptide repeats
MLPRSLVAARALSALGALIAAPVFAFGVGPNVNMVTGTMYPNGDPWLTKQNEPSIAISSRNPRTLIGGSNDYRMVNVPVGESLRGAKAWIHVYKSLDGGTTWYGTPLAGCPDRTTPECNDVTGINGWFQNLNADFSADPTLRAGPYGTFFYSFIAGVRDDSANGVVAVQRFVDRNNAIQRDTDVRQFPADPSNPNANLNLKPAQDPILPDVMWKIDQGTSGQDVDKPWNAADVPRSWNTGTCRLLAWTQGRNDVTPAWEDVPAFNVYVSFANFPGSGNNQHPQAQVAVSTDCGTTFGKPIKLSNSVQKSQGTSLAIDPLTGAVYVAWRDFGSPAAIFVSKSTDGGKTWSNQPKKVAEFIPYDQDAAGSAFRTLGFPSIAVSVKDGVSRVHVAWTQRRAAPATVAPFGCQSPNPVDCDARIVISTSSNGGNSWSAPAAVDSNFTVSYQSGGQTYAHQRGHQVQPALTSVGGKLLVTWIDQRLSHTEEVLRCPSGATCTSVNQLVSIREGKGNLDSACTYPLLQPPLQPLPPPYTAGTSCFSEVPVFSTFMTDGTPGLVRRQTVDTFAAIADAAANPVFQSQRVSQYLFGSTVQGAIEPDGTLNPTQALADIRQKSLNAPNLPLFVNGTAAFIGDYIDAIGQTIVATPDANPARRYKYNVGGTPTGTAAQFTVGGFAPTFHVAFTDNRDVVPPVNGDWTTTTCLETTVTPCGGQTGFAGNRNQNVYSAVIGDSVAYANANSKLLSVDQPRAFVVTVDNFGTSPQTYFLQIVAPAGLTASFDKATFDAAQPAVTSLSVIVQPRSSATRSVWVKANGAADATASLRVQVTGPGYSNDIVLNADPAAPLVGNGDGALSASNPDLANNDLGNVVLSNAVLTNNVLSNNALSNAVLSNNALSNAMLTNVALTNAALSNVVLSNAVLSNAMLSNNALSNVALSNAVLSNAALTNEVIAANALSNVALSNVALSNVALSNAALSNNALTNVALSNTALGNVMLSNAVLSNAALSNAALSNAALSNAALSNNALSNVALSNAPLTDGDLKRIEPANPDLSLNNFTVSDVDASNFADVSFTVRNRGNTDTTLAIKLLLRDASCSGEDPTAECQLPDGFKLQLVLRKIGLTPVAIPPTAPATTVIPGVVPAPLALKLGLQQTNTQVSNVGTPVIVNPLDPSLGRFIPTKADAATLPLSAGERAQVTLRAIGTSAGQDVINLLRWGVKFVVVDASNATRTDIPLIIQTLTVPAVTAGQASSAGISVFGGFGTVAFAEVVCADSEGSPATGGSCPPSFTLGSFTRTGDVSTGQVQFTSPVAGTFYMRVKVGDGSSPAQEDQQLIKVVVELVTPTITFGANFPTSLPFTPSFDLTTLLPHIISPSDGPITFATNPPSAGVCVVSGTFLVPVGIGTCTFLIQQGATQVYKSVEIVSPQVQIQPGSITISVATTSKVYGDPLPSFTPTFSPANAELTCGTRTGTFTFTTAVTATTPVGSYSDVMPGGVTYAFCTPTFVPGTLTVTRATPVFSNLSAPTIGLGTASTTISGRIGYASVFPTGSVDIGLAGTTMSPAIDGTGAFSAAFPTAGLSLGSYPITFAYPAAGTPADGNFTSPVSAASTLVVEGFIGTSVMTQRRAWHTATRLLDRRVLVAGGNDAGGGSTATAEVYCPAVVANCTAADVGKFKAVGNLPSKSAGHTATLLSNGKVLAAGGGNSSSELFDPVTNNWTAAGGMSSQRSWHTASAIVEGGTVTKVLLVGGADNAGKTLDTTMIYNVATGAWTNGPKLATARERHTAVTMADGRILIAGGRTKVGNNYQTRGTVEIYNPATNTMSSAPAMAAARHSHAAALVGTKVVVAGGSSGSADLNTSELFDGTGWTSAGAFAGVRRDAAMSLSPGNELLLAGGQAGTTPLATSNVFDPDPPATWFVTSAMQFARYGHSATPLVDASGNVIGVLVTGGIGAGGTAINTAEIFQ